MNITARLATAAVIVALAGPATAHHSAAMFDHSRVVVLTGTIKAFSYQAPHSWISIVGGPEGAEPHQWDAEAGAPSTLINMGLTRDSLKPGDKVSLGVYPLRDGRSAGGLVYLVSADGHMHGTKPEAAIAPAAGSSSRP